MKRVLILTASFGDGHNAAARNLSDALEALSPDVKVEVVDLFGRCYGTLNSLARKAYNGLVRFAPALWGGIYALLDKPALSKKSYVKLSRLQLALGQLLQDTQPDCVVSTYPVYAAAIQDLFRDHAERPFRFITVVTDSITINAAWLQAPSDLYCVPNEATAEVLRARGVPAERIRALGFPVSPLFCQDPEVAPPDPGEAGPYRLLYLINTGQQKVGKDIRKLLERPEVELTITVGRNAYLKAKLVEKFKEYGHRVQVLGWTNQLPHLMKTHHLLIGKAGGALVQETIAACCPMIANQVIPGQEEGNARLLVEQDIGTVARKPSEVVHAVKEAFRKDARGWRRWRQNLARLSKPDAALRIAEMVLAECDADGPKGMLPPTLLPARRAPASPPPGPRPNGSRPLLCDFHLWKHQETFAPLLDAWEIANRNNMFNPVSARRLPYVANSDFHKPKHIYSWKTLVTCEKHPEAIKECIRKNERIAITLYRENASALSVLASSLAELAEPATEGTPETGKPSLLPAA